MLQRLVTQLANMDFALACLGKAFNLSPPWLKWEYKKGVCLTGFSQANERSIKKTCSAVLLGLTIQQSTYVNITGQFPEFQPIQTDSKKQNM